MFPIVQDLRHGRLQKEENKTLHAKKATVRMLLSAAKSFNHSNGFIHRVDTKYLTFEVRHPL